MENLENQADATSGNVPQGTEGSLGQSENETKELTENQNDSSQITGQSDGQESVIPETPEQKYSTLEKSYKDLQTEFGKRNQSDKELMARFEKHGGLDNVTQYIDYLSNNPRFAEFMKVEQQRNITGVDTADMDDDSKKAVSMVQDIVKNTIDTELARLKKTEIDPLANSYKDKILDENLTKLEAEFGEVYLENKKAMAEIAQKMPLERQDNMGYEDLKDLMWNTSRRNGNFEKHMAQTYQKNLEKKKNNSSDQPPTSGNNFDTPPPKNLTEAVQNAKKKLGITGELSF